MARLCADCGAALSADATKCPSCDAPTVGPSDAPNAQTELGPARPIRRGLLRRRNLVIAAMALALVVGAFFILRGHTGGAANDEIALYDFELFPLRVGGRCGYVDTRTGESRINPQFDRAEFFTAAGLAAVQVGESWGLIDRTGRIVVSPQFRSLRYLGGPGLFEVPIGDNVGMIDGTGRMVANGDYQTISTFDADGLASFQKQGSQGCINTAGQIVQRPPHGCGVVARDQGFSSPVERPTIPRSRFQEGLAVVGSNVEGQGSGFMDAQGHWVISPQFSGAYPFDGSGLAAAAASSPGGSAEALRFGYIDRTGRFIIPAQFNAALPFNNAPLAPVLVGDRWGFVDRTGTIRISPQFVRADSFRNESGEWLAMVDVSDHRTGFIGPDGAYRIPPQFVFATPFDRNGRAIVQAGGRGLVDASGHYVANPTFTAIMRLTGMNEYLFVRLPPAVHPTGPGYRGPPEQSAANSTNIEFGLMDRDGRIVSSFRGGICPATF